MTAAKIPFLPLPSLISVSWSRASGEGNVCFLPVCSYLEGNLQAVALQDTPA